ncbi:MAG: PD-(D/E)XK nuclease-like domain-containing protein [Sideroxyarcus sp.]|nr:PD-(D/E)XK nuclease-like domain-containing protein [Sideroxyarcus sp.]
MKRFVRNLPIKDYHAGEEISHSGIVKLLKSPEHYLQYKNGEDESTPAMEFGSAFHAFILEPEVFAKEYVLVPKFDKRTTAGKEAAAKWDEENVGKTPLAADQIEALTAMRTSVSKHVGASKLLSKGEAESSLFWTDEITGLKCRIRPDWYSQQSEDWLVDGHVTDLKSCVSANKTDFAKAAANLGYDIQAAFYIDGVKAVTGKSVDFVFIAVEKTAPYSTACYKASQEMIEVGRAKYRGALELLKWCQENKQYPGYQPNGEIETIDLPRWAANFELEA